MKWLASRRWRIFLVAWLVFSVHFATNVVREHYPAFTLAGHGTLRVDEYQGFHSDIFVHRDGHSYINNQVFTSALAAIPLLVFDPLLDRLEARSLERLTRDGVGDDEYRIDKPMRQEFFRLVKARGLDLRFGASTVVTSVFFMAPLTAAFLAFFHGALQRRGVEAGQATALTFLLGFGTPLFFRATVLGHNMFVMFGMFAAFALIWARPGGDEAPISRGRLLASGFWAGVTLAVDYMGVVVLAVLAAWIFARRPRASLRAGLADVVMFAAGSIPPLIFLFGTQWAMFGHPFYPAQHWMPDQNEYAVQGLRGMSWPAPDLVLQNLFHPGFGLFAWAPILALACLPWRGVQGAARFLERRDRRFIVLAALALLVFSSANQYARLQWNSGFRYLLPLVPLLMLRVAGPWSTLGRAWRVGLGAGVVVHAWVLVVFRDPVLTSWQLFLAEGPQLPWYRVVSLTSPPGSPWLGTWWVPSLVLILTVLGASAVWRIGARLERAHAVD
jgi:hypothetical protein